jgi:hypothetical protein
MTKAERQDLALPQQVADRERRIERGGLDVL